jgi:hypothetical protein
MIFEDDDGQEEPFITKTDVMPSLRLAVRNTLGLSPKVYMF